jgi:hypothetical protein
MPEEPRLVPTGDIRDVVDMGIALQAVATEHNIHNVFDDGGYKELLLLRLFNLRKLYREGDDAQDEHGRRYEIKTVARVSSIGKVKRSLGVTTEHTLTQANIDRYRAVYLWIIAVFNQSEPESIYELAPEALEPFFATWEVRLADMQRLAGPGSAPVHINNPKIPLRHVIERGIQVWPPRDVPLPEPVEQALIRTEQLEPPG